MSFQEQLTGAIDRRKTRNRHFNILENVTNTDKQDLKTMVDRGRYFSIFAPRQSGKTTFLEGFCLVLEQDSTYVPIILSFQRYKSLDKQTFYQQIQKELYSQLTNRLTSVDCPSLDAAVSFLDSHQLTNHIALGELFAELNRLLELKKIIVFIDEFDGIPEDELENFLPT